MEAIESGNHPEWEIGVQLFTEAQAEAFSFHVLDSTKLVQEELVPVTLVGRMVLTRNPVLQKPKETTIEWLAHHGAIKSPSS